MKKPKAIKVFYGDVRLKDIYPYATKWQVFKYRTMRAIRRTFMVASIALAGVLVIQTARYIFPVKAYATNIFVDNLTPKIDELKEKAVSTIRDCERAGHSEDDGILIFDSNNKASIGTYQYQKATVIYYYHTLYNKTITPKDAVLIALDDDKAHDLTKDVLFKTKNGTSNWYNCSVKHNIKQQVAVINELQ